MSERILHWDGCLNTRDLGGLPLGGGGLTRRGQIVRSDNIRHLSDEGWATLRAHGVKTLVDLRFAIERSEAPVPDGVAVINISLFGEQDAASADHAAEVLREAPDEVTAVGLFYLDTLETCAPNIAEAVEAIATAPVGAVGVHCYVGKDRTGIVAALLLELAGVEHDAIVEDYALTEGRVGPLVDGWIADASDPHEQMFRKRISTAPAGAMDAMLNGLRESHGGAEEYLRSAGLEDGILADARSRLR